ncbi:DUF2505 domain-containing protein [Rhodococcus sp. X156]|uniref:DUF2505 domain-containing protein n=1 Tax=Rhodococcus sp. X156 TaxID=2499145 RepID=UPI000FDC0FD1|nr:DUF2505 domain-containing protein [Rhodococcus sp. X156]
MSRRIEHAATYDRSPQLLHTVLLDEAYWRARVEAVGGPAASLDSVERVDGGVEVRLTQSIPAEHLPSVVRKLRSGDLLVQRIERWGSLDGFSASGSFRASVPGTPVTLDGAHALSGDDASTTSRTTGTAKVAVPLVGAKIEKIIAENIAELLVIEQRFTVAWLAQR